MAAKKLTKAEKVWLEEVEAILSNPPSKRLACYTIGDPSLHFYDRNVSAAWEKANPYEQLDATELHRKAGSALGDIDFKVIIDSCAG